MKTSNDELDQKFAHWVRIAVLREQGKAYGWDATGHVKLGAEAEERALRAYQDAHLIAHTLETNVAI